MNSSVSSGGFFHVIDGIARLLLVALFALLPVFLIPMPWAGISQGKMFVVVGIGIVTLFLWMLARLMEGTLHIPRSWLLYAAALLPIAYLISTAASGWVESALVGQGVEQDTLAAITVWFTIFALSAFLLYGNQAAQKMSLQAFTLGLTILTAFQTLYIFFPTWFSLGFLTGETANIFGSWHDLGIISGFGLFFALLLMRSDIFAGWKKIILAILAALSVFLVTAIHFQDVFWATAALAFIQGLFEIRTVSAHSISQKMLKRALPWMILAAVLAGCAYFNAQISEKLPGRINIVQTEVRPSWQGTFDVAKQSLQAPSEFVFGAGPNSFLQAWGLHKPASVNTTPFWDSDFNFGVGIIPTSVFTSGAFGLIAWAGVILAILMMAWRFVSVSQPASHRILTNVALLGSVYFIAYHMIYTPGTAITGALFMMLGLLVASADTPVRTISIGVQSIRTTLKLIVTVVFILAGFAALFMVGRQLLSNSFVNRGSYGYQLNGNVEAASASVNRALQIAPKNDRAHRAATELGVIKLSELMSQGASTDAARAQLQATLQSTIQHGLTAISINEASYQNWLLLAQVYGNLAGANVEGSFASAKDAYQKAFAANPTNPVPKLRLAQLAAMQNDRAEARKQLTEAIALKADFAAAHYLLSQVEAADGKVEAAVSAAAAAAQLVPSDPLGWFNLGYILYAGGQHRDAALSLQQAVSLAPDYSNALFYLGLSYYRLGMPNDAVVVLERVAALNPDEGTVKAMIANIKAGKDPSEGLTQASQGQ